MIGIMGISDLNGFQAPRKLCVECDAWAKSEVKEHGTV